MKISRSQNVCGVAGACAKQCSVLRHTVDALICFGGVREKRESSRLWGLSRGKLRFSMKMDECLHSNFQLIKICI